MTPTTRAQLMKVVGDAMTHLRVSGYAQTADALFQAIIAAAPPAPPVASDGWQDISTAPKDGTNVLVWDGHYRFIATYQAYTATSGGYWWVEDGVELDPPPTHWMPLPPAPPPDAPQEKG